MTEYIIVSKTAIEERIKELKESLKISEDNSDEIRAGIESFEIKQLEWVLSQSTPLIPEIEKAFDEGNDQKATYITKQNYISNLKLDI